jgi:hypothetical protein
VGGLQLRGIVEEVGFKLRAALVVVIPLTNPVPLNIIFEKTFL